jgi:hypothetical protein
VETGIGRKAPASEGGRYISDLEAEVRSVDFREEIAAAVGPFLLTFHGK